LQIYIDDSRASVVFIERIRRRQPKENYTITDFCIEKIRQKS